MLGERWEGDKGMEWVEDREEGDGADRRNEVKGRVQSSKGRVKEVAEIGKADDITKRASWNE